MRTRSPGMVAALWAAACISCSGATNLPPEAAKRRAADGTAVASPTSPGATSSAETGTRQLSLQEAIGLALANSPRLAEAQWQTVSAEAETEQSASQRWPTVTANAGYQRWLDPQRLVPIAKPGDAGVFTRDIVSGDISLHMPLYAGGSIDASVSSSKHREQAARHTLERSRQTLAYEVTVVFYEIIGQRRLLQAFEATGQALAEERRVLAERIAADKAAPVDTLRLDVRIAELDQSIAQARNELAIRRRVLATLLGLDPAVVEVDARGELLDDAPRRTGSQQRGNRADLLAARGETEARRLEIDAAQGRRWPKVDGSVSYGLRADLDGHLEDVGMAGVFVSVPLFESGLTSARVREAEARYHMAEERLRGLGLEARLQAESARIDVMTAHERLKTSSVAIEQARRAFDIEREKLDIGRGTTTEVLDAHAALVKAEAAYFGNLTALSIAYAKLSYALGEPTR